MRADRDRPRRGAADGTKADTPREARRAVLRDAYARAAADPAFMADMEEIDRAFDVTVGDGLEDAD